MRSWDVVAELVNRGTPTQPTLLGRITWKLLPRAPRFFHRTHDQYNVRPASMAPRAPRHKGSAKARRLGPRDRGFPHAYFFKAPPPFCLGLAQAASGSTAVKIIHNGPKRIHNGPKGSRGFGPRARAKGFAKPYAQLAATPPGYTSGMS